MVLDISDVKRLGSLADTVRALTKPRVVIDHHVPSSDPPGETILADTAACATGELIYDFACTLDLEITPAIARALYISESTAKVHVKHILEKLGVRSRVEAARAWRTDGLSH